MKLKTITPIVIVAVIATFLSFRFATSSNSYEMGDSLVKWRDFHSALKESQKTGKKIFMDVYTTWCGPCRKLNSVTFADPVIADILNNDFIPVKFDAESDDDILYLGKTYKNQNPGAGPRRSTHDFAAAIAASNGRLVYPTMIIFDENQQKIDFNPAITGFRTPKDMEPLLTYVGKDHFRKQSWEDFMSTFKSKL